MHSGVFVCVCVCVYTSVLRHASLPTLGFDGGFDGGIGGIGSLPGFSPFFGAAFVLCSAASLVLATAYMHAHIKVCVPVRACHSVCVCAHGAAVVCCTCMYSMFVAFRFRPIGGSGDSNVNVRERERLFALNVSARPSDQISRTIGYCLMSKVLIELRASARVRTRGGGNGGWTVSVFVCVCVRDPASAECGASGDTLIELIRMP